MAESPGPSPPGRVGRTWRRFLDGPSSWVLLPGVVAFAVRAGFVLSGFRDTLTGDARYYHLQANLLADGNGFVRPGAIGPGQSAVPGADHPPLYTMWLALWSLLGLDSVRWHLFAGVITGTATVIVVALVAARVGGTRAGVLAGTLTALWPNLVLWDSSVHAETVAALAVAAFTLLAVRYLEGPSVARLAWVGAIAGVAGLARAELALIGLAVVPLVMATSPLRWARRCLWVAAAAAAAALVVAPWAAYNQTRFEEPVVLSTGLGLVLVSSNCDRTYYGPHIGYWWFGCSVAGNVSARSDRATDPSTQDLALREVATRYIREHQDRVPAVVTARVLRVAGVWAPRQAVALGEASEGIEPWIGAAIASSWWLGAGLAAVGGVQLRRRGSHLSPYLAPAITVAATAAITYGIVRFRAPCEPSVLVLAGVGGDHLLRLGTRRLSRGRRGPLAGRGAPPGTTEPPG